MKEVSDTLNKEYNKIAAQSTRSETPTVFFLTRILLPKYKFLIFCYCYTYFRWLDDFIDGEDFSRAELVPFMDDQKKLITSVFNDCSNVEARGNLYEQLLICFIKQSIQNGLNIYSPVMRMFSALEFDVNRRFLLSTKASLDAYSYNLGTAYIGFFYSLMVKNDESNQESIKFWAGYAAHLVHIIRDFFQDLSQGFFNISFEDMTRLNVSLTDLKTIEEYHWISDLSKRAWKYFYLGLYEISRIPNWRFRLLAYALSAKYMLLLEQIRSNCYRISVPVKVSLLENIKMLCWAVKKTIERNIKLEEIEKISLFS